MNKLIHLFVLCSITLTAHAQFWKKYDYKKNSIELTTHVGVPQYKKTDGLGTGYVIDINPVQDNRSLVNGFGIKLNYDFFKGIVGGFTYNYSNYNINYSIESSTMNLNLLPGQQDPIYTNYFNTINFQSFGFTLRKIFNVNSYLSIAPTIDLYYINRYKIRKSYQEGYINGSGLGDYAVIETYQSLAIGTSSYLSKYQEIRFWGTVGALNKFTSKNESIFDFSININLKINKNVDLLICPTYRCNKSYFGLSVRADYYDAINPSPKYQHSLRYNMNFKSVNAGLRFHL